MEETMNRRLSLLTVAALTAVVAVAGCSASVATPQPTSAPGGGGGGGGIPTFALPSIAIPGGSGAAGTDCAGYQPGTSFPPDSALLAKYPQQVAGQPITDPVALSFLSVLCGGGQTAVDAAKQGASFLGVDISTMSFGSFTATVNGSSVTVQAMRTPGQDAGKIISSLQTLGAFVGINAGSGSISQGNVGGKNVTIITDSSGSKTYLYVSGDTLFIMDGADDASAQAVLQAMP
jgi:hypothetical protein